MNENLQRFINENKNKLVIKKNDHGDIISIESLVPSTELNFYKTNCKVDKIGNKFILNTIDGEEYIFNFKKDDVEMLNSLLKNKIFKHKKIKSNKINSNFGVFIKSIPSKVKELKIKKSIESIQHAPNPVGNYSELKISVENLITKLDAIIEKYSKDPKCMVDDEFVYYKIKYRDLKARYEKAIQMEDTSEMLNVKTKLVSLSGRIIAREKQLDNNKNNQSVEEMLESIPDATDKIENINKEEPLNNNGTLDDRIKLVYSRSVETAYNISKIIDDNKDIDFLEEKEELKKLTIELQDLSSKTRELPEIKIEDVDPYIELSRKIFALKEKIEEKIKKIRSVYKESKNESATYEENNIKNEETFESLNLVEEKIEKLEESDTPKLPAESSIEKIEDIQKEDIVTESINENKSIPVGEDNGIIESKEEKDESIEIARDEERKKLINSDIEKSNKKINDIEENIKYFENRIKQTDELIKTSNFDSMEINSYNKVKENYQEKLKNQKVLLEQAKEELKQNINRLTAFMNEEVTYYVDGKPYKKATRAEIEKYKMQHISDEKRKEDLSRQKDLLEERKELEKKLKENYEALKSLSTFEDEMILSKEEPSIEDAQETIKRFH